jgi:hypothetical protein
MYHYHLLKYFVWIRWGKPAGASKPAGTGGERECLCTSAWKPSEARESRSSTLPRRGPTSAFQTFFPELVIDCPFILIAEDFESFGYLEVL